jgi:hypothetical protein
MLALFSVQFILPAMFGDSARIWIGYAFFAWTAAEVLRLIARKKLPVALTSFVETWREHVGTGSR